VKVTVGKKTTQADFEVVPAVLFACAILLLGYCGIRPWWTPGFSEARSRDLDRLLRERRAASLGRAATGVRCLSEAVPAFAADGLIGRIEIPRVLLSVVVVEGVDKTTLRRAVGHISRHGASGRGRQRGASRASRYVFSSAQGCEDQGRNFKSPR